MNAIDALFAKLRAAKRKAFMPFLTAGDPDIAGTVQIARALAGNGLDLLELGFPYSDPIADGPVIQASYTRALNAGVKLDAMLECGRQIAQSPEFARGSLPVVAMSAFSLIHRRGPTLFLDQAQRAGFSGAIVPDLPLEEADSLAHLARERDFKLVQLITPTTPRERARRIAELSTGFLYCVSVTGITGQRERLPEELLDQLVWLRGQTDLPLCVGFGVSKPEHVRMFREVADGVIVGSAFVRHLEGPANLETKTAALTSLCRSLAAELNPA